MSKYKDKIFNILYYIFLSLILLILFFILYNFISLKILKKNYTNIFGYTFFEVASGSMSDAININDLVIVKIGSKYKIDDIVTYKSNNEFITHRVKKIQKEYIITKGDSNDSYDKPVKKNDVLGVVKYIIRDAFIWQRILLTPKVFVSLIITLILFCLCFSKRV